MTDQQAKEITTTSKLMRRVVAHDIARERHAERERYNTMYKLLDVMDSYYMYWKVEGRDPECLQRAQAAGQEFARLNSLGWKFKEPPGIYPAWLYKVIPRHPGDDNLWCCSRDQEWRFSEIHGRYPLESPDF